nr:RagB/SusD family nutrient uptake outer membrane protein [uncultured Pedobacter sp.]
MRLYKLLITKTIWLQKLFLLLSIAIIVPTSCKKLVEVDPPVTSINAENVYTNDLTAAAVLTGIYSNLSSSAFSFGGLTSMSLFTGLSGDELTLMNGSTNTAYTSYYRNALTSSNTSGSDFWVKIYPTLFVANSAIEGLSNSITLTPAVKQQLMGEAKFIRAFCYFYLINLYGDVPLVVGTDYKVNSLLPRSSRDQVYQQIIGDLKDAQELLSDKYVKSDAVTPYSSGAEERVRPTKGVATALLARIYLYIGDYANAELQASSVISKISTYDIVALNSSTSNVFAKNSKETIWQLQPVKTGENTQEARLFILPSGGPTSSWPVYLSNALANSFEPGDQRKINWVGNVTVTSGSTSTIYYYPYKYKVIIQNAPVTEYLMVFRLAEVYLIRAEARAKLNNISGAQSDLNVIRNRAGLTNTTASTESTLLASILHERQVELFCEWGHRWFDLKRTNEIDHVMNIVTPQKGGTWNSNFQWYPISLGELQRAPNIIQNSGY